MLPALITGRLAAYGNIGGAVGVDYLGVSHLAHW
jgi:hypothetical protein